MGFDWAVALGIVVLVFLVGGLKIFIAVRHKQRTGNDTGGALFWKRVFARFGGRR